MKNCPGRRVKAAGLPDDESHAGNDRGCHVQDLKQRMGQRRRERDPT